MHKRAIILLLTSLIIMSCSNEVNTITPTQTNSGVEGNEENINDVGTNGDTQKSNDFEVVYNNLGKSEESCKKDFNNFYTKSLEFEGYDFDIQYYDLVKKENDCLLGYYYAHEARHYWNVINLSKDDNVEFETNCMPDYDVDTNTLTDCDSEAIEKTHLEYQAFMSEFF